MKDTMLILFYVACILVNVVIGVVVFQWHWLAGAVYFGFWGFSILLAFSAEAQKADMQRRELNTPYNQRVVEVVEYKVNKK